jgi:aerobic carbon-monoxide dehydrogenase large subunit
MAAWFRREDAAATTGSGCYVSDVSLPGMLFAAFVRSPYAHARFTALNVQEAQSALGVKAVLTAAQLGHLPMPLVNPLVAGELAVPRPLISSNTTHFVGEPIAIVVADTNANARAAADLIWAQWEDLGAGADHQANAPAHFQVNWQTPDFDPSIGESKKGCQRVRVTARQPRVAAMPLEPRSAVAQWNSSAASLTVWLPTQTPFRARADLMRALQLELYQVRVIAPDVGGAFGARASIYPEDIMLAATAQFMQATIKWAGTRSEEFLASTHGRGAQYQIDGWLNSLNQLEQVQAQFEFPLGAWLPYSAVVPARNAARMMPGPYSINAIRTAASGHLSHAAPINIYRGAGRPEACMALERLMDEAARVANIDPLQFRRQHCLSAEQFPRHLISGAVIDSANSPLLLDHASKLFDYLRLRQEQVARQAAGELIGIGIALYVEPCGEGWEHVELDWRVQTDSDPIYSDPIYLTITTGATGQGQGRLTQVAQLASQWLDVPMAHIRVRCGDTSESATGIGALASRSTAIGASALFEACEKMKVLRAQNAPLPWAVKHTYTAAAEAWSSGCVMTQVNIDRDTGVLAVEKIVWIDDAGNILDPVLAKGQLLGGLAQGLGQALYERMVYDDQGQLITGSMMDYAMPRADQIPPIILGSINTPTQANRLGAKGVGEAGCIGVPAALLNAAIDALAPLGITSLELPLTSDQLWQAMANHDPV